MKNEDFIMLILWGLSALGFLIVGIGYIIKSEGESENVRTGVMCLLIAFTPGSLLIGCLLLFIGFMLLIVEGPTYLIVKLKSLKNGTRTETSR